MKPQNFLKTISLMLIMAFIMIDSPVMAQRKRALSRDARAEGRFQNRPPQENARCLGLPGITTEQKEQIEKFRLENMKNIQQLRNEMFEKKAHLRTLLGSDKPDTDKINKTIDDIAGIRAQMEKGRMDTHLKIKGILTEEQKILFNERGNWGRKGGLQQEYTPMGRGRGVYGNCPFR